MYALVGVVVSVFLDSVPNKVCVGVGAQANGTSVPRAVLGREKYNSKCRDTHKLLRRAASTR